MDIKEVIKKGLEGYPVKLRYGYKAYIRHNEQELEVSHPLMGFYIEEGGARDIVWTTEGKYFIFPYDIVGLWEEPLKFEHWSILHESIKYIAKDEDGCWWGYRGKPTRNNNTNVWDSPPKFDIWDLESLCHSVFPVCDWEDSLIERPKDIK